MQNDFIRTQLTLINRLARDTIMYCVKGVK